MEKSSAALMLAASINRSLTFVCRGGAYMQREPVAEGYVLRGLVLVIL